MMYGRGVGWPLSFRLSVRQVIAGSEMDLFETNLRIISLIKSSKKTLVNYANDEKLVKSF